MFKAIAKMFDGEKQWDVVIYPNYATFEDAERDARRFAKRYDNNSHVTCLWVQVLNA